ncbi:MAG TPA: hypothetical protein DCE24_08255 [Porphyromonadaceae bacterium]|nr:hypothetical protein [Porphyromonadaceae bacterium]
MTPQEYEAKKRECWEKFRRENLDGEVQWQPVSRYDVFCAAFDRAYALGKQDKDAEGEEMLTVPRSQMQKLYASTKKVNDPSSKDYINGILNTLDTLFGSKCLPDLSENLSEQKPAESKFKIGDHVRVISADKYGESGYIVKVEEDDGFFYTIEGMEDWRFFEPNLEPYAEPEEESRNLSQETANCDKHFDNILKDGFSKERRLNVAAMAMQGILSNPQLLKIAIETYQEEIGSPDIYVAVAKTAKEQADALIAECEQTEKLKGE